MRVKLFCSILIPFFSLNLRIKQQLSINSGKLVH